MAALAALGTWAAPPALAVDEEPGICVDHDLWNRAGATACTGTLPFCPVDEGVVVLGSGPAATYRCPLGQADDR